MGEGHGGRDISWEVRYTEPADQTPAYHWLVLREGSTIETETARQANRALSFQGGAVHLKKTEWPRVLGTAAHPSDSVAGCCGTSGEKLQRKRGSAVGNSDTSLSFSPYLRGSQVKAEVSCPCCLFAGRRVGGHVY